MGGKTPLLDTFSLKYSSEHETDIWSTAEFRRSAKTFKRQLGLIRRSRRLLDLNPPVRFFPALPASASVTKSPRGPKTAFRRFLMSHEKPLKRDLCSNIPLPRPLSFPPLPAITTTPSPLPCMRKTREGSAATRCVFEGREDRPSPIGGSRRCGRSLLQRWDTWNTVRSYGPLVAGHLLVSRAETLPYNGQDVKAHEEMIFFEDKRLEFREKLKI